MRAETLDILRCPYLRRTPGRSSPRCSTGATATRFVDGDPRLPLLHLSGRRRHSRPAPEPARRRAREQIEAGRPDLARADDVRARRTRRAPSASTRVASSPHATYRDVVEALGPSFEGGYFLYRFSDPTYLVARRWSARWPWRVLGGGGRAIDLCGGSGHLTRSLVDLSSPAAGPRRSLFLEGVARAPLHGAGMRAGLLRRQRAAALRARRVRRRGVLRRVPLHLDQAAVRVRDDAPGRRPAAPSLVTHTHNERTWNPSAGHPLPPEAYRDLFATLEPRLFAEARAAGGRRRRRAARPVAARLRRRRSTPSRR